MKRMKVREFRAKLSELSEEPIEVVRYSETVGFWVPIGMTTEPKKRVVPRKKPIIARASDPSAEEIDRFITRMRKLSESVKALK